MNALSPLDGRYAKSCKVLTDFAGQDAYTTQLYLVEVRWLQYLSKILPELTEIDPLIVEELASNPDVDRIRQIEVETGHDIKAVEYYLKERLKAIGLNRYVEYTHLGCTSEDITNIAYAEITHNSLQVLDEVLIKLAHLLNDLALNYADLPMLARTHGQPASPTTVGKEFRVYERRLVKEKEVLDSIDITAKMNGASGNHNALHIAYPDINWVFATSAFIKDLDLIPANHTTQVEPHDRLAEILHALCRINTILTDLSCDMWQYISMRYFRLKVSRVGSSTMPHKINPIEFENAEGNFGLANSIMQFMASKLQVSRMQRDLSGSTVKRNLGSAFGYCLIGYKSVLRGLQVSEADKIAISCDLAGRIEILAEAYQTVMRKHGISGYEKVREILTTNDPANWERDLNAELRDLLDGFDIPEEAKQRLLDLTPNTYIGHAAQLAGRFDQK